MSFQVIRIIPYSAVQLFAYEFYKVFLQAFHILNIFLESLPPCKIYFQQ